jgi:hypothetical protein
MTAVTMTRGASSLRADMTAESAAYRHRTLVNVLAIVAITLLMISGHWVVNTLVEATQDTQDIRLLAP